MRPKYGSINISAVLAGAERDQRAALFNEAHKIGKEVERRRAIYYG